MTLKTILLGAFLVVEISSAAAASKVKSGECNIYADASFKGLSKYIEPDASGTFAYNIADLHQAKNLDRQVSSVACGKMCSLTLYDQPDQKGLTKTVAGAAATLGEDWDNKARSVQIQCTGPEFEAAATVNYACEPKLNVAVRFVEDGKFAYVTGLQPEELKLENTKSASGAEYVSIDPSESDLVISVFTKGDDALITINDPSGNDKQWNCKAQ
jgi:membrane-bound inhibitor of C-type lysozyme